ncbi:MAG: bifunctional [glutamine synthetase] adenylyltransferase/[glutamine synthetase]-adenylyl-L-tyrosine phosphorylase [Cellulomonadaceae bacterium]
MTTLSRSESPAGSGPRGVGRPMSLGAQLRRAGVLDPARAERMLADDCLRTVIGTIEDHPDALTNLGEVADPDQALLGLVRLSESVTQAGEATVAQMRAVLRDDGARAGLLSLLGASPALGDEIIRHPDLLESLADDDPGIGQGPEALRAEMLRAVGAGPDAVLPVAADAGPGAIDRLRRAYRRRLLRIAAADLTCGEPLSVMPRVAAALADLAGASLEAGLAVGRAGLADHGAGVRIAVIGMGKCGGRELNYVSDVDVIYVVEPADGYDEGYALEAGTRLAASLSTACSAPAGEPPLWPVDAALRPEGKDGPLVRTLASHKAYYERWAKTWEFQALLKARPVAGDRGLGAAYREMVDPFVWQAVTRDNFVSDSQAMRRRVEQHVPLAEADRQLKLGKGGLRDVEFTVQLLQLVHGRTDASIRGSSTLGALAALSEGGYVGREDAARMAVSYRFLRALEHRIQMHRMRRTHLLPTAETDLRRLARSLGMRTEGAEGLLERWRATRREVRAMHEALFYRPILPAVAQLSSGEASLRPEAAQARLAAIGYRDPAGALRHIAALTDGVSRRAAIQRQLLPVMIGWFAEGADPDAGLLGFRTLSEAMGTTHWYLKLLRDSGTAAYRLALLLSSSRYMAQALSASPESVRWLGDDDELVAVPEQRLVREVDAVLTRATEVGPAAQSLRALRRRELARTAAAELLHMSDPEAAGRAISAVTDVVLQGTLRVAEVSLRDERGLAAAPVRMLVVAMGRLGGHESGYGSDADVMFVYEPVAGEHDGAAQKFALEVATRMRTLLGQVGPEPALQVDADLRPEGRQGPLVRSFDSYVEYYARWSQVWESQALLRARPVAGDEGLAQRFVDLIASLRYPQGLDAAATREIRRIKARVESERLPRGADPTRHVKLGRGGISDVEWTVQLAQLQHAHAHAALRTTSTLGALDALGELGLMDSDDVATLRQAWLLGSGIRNAIVLWTGRAGGSQADVLPTDRQALRGVARILDYPADEADELAEEYLRASRRARGVVERVFYDS